MANPLVRMGIFLLCPMPLTLIQPIFNNFQEMVLQPCNLEIGLKSKYVFVIMWGKISSINLHLIWQENVIDFRKFVLILFYALYCIFQLYNFQKKNLTKDLNLFMQQTSSFFKDHFR